MKYGLIGEKLSHSFSKVIHEHIAPYTYELKEICPEDLDEFLEKRDFCAINVTIPYKQAVISHLDFVSENVKSIGACNTIVNKDGKLYGYNTDAFGLMELLKRNDFDLKNRDVLILGSGGTSKTAHFVCESMGARAALHVSRTGEVNYENVFEAAKNAAYIINTTPVGMFPNSNNSPIDISRFPKLLGVCDVVYNPLCTIFAQSARELGKKYCCGLFMLCAQAIRASELFLDKKYDKSVFDEVFSFVMAQKQNIVLIGMPGCGKSTLGMELSKRLKKDFFDTDVLIEEKIGMHPSKIIEELGEKEFRKIESDVILSLSDTQNAVIATGGGAVLKAENVRNLRKNGFIVFLDRDLEKIVPTLDRPLSKDQESLKKRYAERLPIYLNACDRKVKIKDDIAQNTDEILKVLK